MKIAIAGLRGLPSSYSGFETFIGELAPRLVEKGHEVTIYCRKPLFKDRPATYRGMSMKYLPSIEHKIFSTLSHSFLSIVHASCTDIDFLFVVNAANGIYGIIPKAFGKQCALNVDGMEWLRPKWNSLAKWFFKTSARLGTKFYDEIITDAEEMHRQYAKEFGIDSTYIAYGANIEESTNPEFLEEYGLKPFGYYLIASRLVPDNNADLIIEGFVESNSQHVLAVAGGAHYAKAKAEREFVGKLRELANEKVKFLGHVSKTGHIKELHCNAYAYIHGHQYGGINPALLKALGYSNCVLALNTPFNSEALEGGKFGLLYDSSPAALAARIQFIESNPSLWEEFRKKAPYRIRERFTWDAIADQYEKLFLSLQKGKNS